MDHLGLKPPAKSDALGIFIVFDHFTELVFLKLVKLFITALIVENLKEHNVNVFGSPDTIVSDTVSPLEHL